jgi:hypothetical protein
MKQIISALILVLLVGCTRIEYLEYRGPQAWPTGSAFVQEIEDIEIYEGLPSCNYDVVGLIDVYNEKPFYQDDTICKKVLKLVKEHGGDAILLLSDRTISSGYLKMGQVHKEAASIDTGRSNQPEMIVTNMTNDVATSYKKSLRSSLFVIKWKK